MFKEKLQFICQIEKEVKEEQAAAELLRVAEKK
jgi:hypothetical protein